jgi:hypothetical protein
METELKRQGKFGEYTHNLVSQGVKTYIKDIEDLILEIALEDSNENFITEHGDIEKWAGKGIDKQKIRSVIDCAKSGYLQPTQVQELLDAVGIPRAKEMVASSKEQAIEAGKKLGSASPCHDNLADCLGKSRLHGPSG